MADERPSVLQAAAFTRQQVEALLKITTPYVLTGEAIIAALGYTPANAANVVTLDDAQTITGIKVFSSGNVEVRSSGPATNANYWLRDDAGLNQGVLYWQRSDDTIRLLRYNAAGTVPEGTLTLQATNLLWNSNAVWHAGNFTPSDYLPVTGGALSGSLSVAGSLTASGNIVITAGYLDIGSSRTSDTIIEIGGRAGSATITGIDFHTGATATSYDVRILATGGNGVNGGGALSITALASTGVSINGNQITSTGVGAGTAAVSPSDAFHASTSAGQQVAVRFSHGATLRGLIGVPGTAGQIIIGSNVGDLCIRSENGVVRFGNGNTVFGVFDSTRLVPAPDNTLTCGGPINRWSVVYAATGAINTSDARDKTEVSPLSTGEVAAGVELSGAVGTFQWLASISEKGDAARMHVGLTVQRAIQIMESHGLDPMAYGFICYDEWEGEPEQREWDEAAEEWVVVRAARPGGNTYGFRHDQLLLFITAAERSARQALEARVAALEAA